MTDVSEGLPLAGSGVSVQTPGAIIARAIPGFDSESEQALVRRYGKPTRKTKELVYEFTRDPALLHQYYELYEREFKSIYKTPNFRVVESDYDRKAHILIARQGNLCVGGARISVTTPRRPEPLPLEINGFKLEDHFPELRLKEMRYGQASRFAIMPDFRGSNVARDMFWHLYRKVIALKIDVLFSAAPIYNARVYRQHCIAMGLKEVKIHSNIELPDYPTYEEVKHYLISGKIDKSLIKDTDISKEDIEIGADEGV